MQPTVSTISAAGQVEATGSIQASGRLEGGVVYAPVSHVLVSVAGTYKPMFAAPPTYVFGTRQWEAGVGSYVGLGEHSRLTGLLGYGRAITKRGDYNLLSNETWDVVQADYSKSFAQLGYTLYNPRFSFHWLVRYSYLAINQLTVADYYRNTLQPLDLTRLDRLDALFCFRSQKGLPPHWRWQLSAGWSVPTRQYEVLDEHGYEIPEARRAQFVAVMLGVGVVFCPTH
ncbi:hypothetical protein Q5H93_10555 [Hymenobacter sp. ASUV-10]|uniref:Outer membrane protein beta-barrel domain-containing protein n=1 Tax=Hymenobacter aranciens TaxID=3063996 RepID=A0ABT9BF88_9BACT|nr:hypothetical protein [Hymenobacter sp. ASUV-10]MDO7875173.1 hypothetical protein [Hymenobacter sp. ASUV-10]